MKRDNFTCRLTGQRGGDLQVHHIRPLCEILDEFLGLHADLHPRRDLPRLVALALDYAPLWDVENGMTLSVPAHRRLHAYRLDLALAVQVATLKTQGLSERKMAKLLGRTKYEVGRALRVLAAASGTACQHVA